MISLREPATPYTLDLVYGIQVTVKPLTTSGMLVAQAAVRRRIERPDVRQMRRHLSIKKLRDLRAQRLRTHHCR